MKNQLKVKLRKEQWEMILCNCERALLAVDGMTPIIEELERISGGALYELLLNTVRVLSRLVCWKRARYNL